MNRGATPRCHQLTRQNQQTQCNQQNYKYIGIKSIKKPSEIQRAACQKGIYGNRKRELFGNRSV